MEDKDKIFDAFRNCITEPKCKDCPWESCEEFHQTKKIPLDLCLDILKLLKEQETEKYSTDHDNELIRHVLSTARQHIEECLNKAKVRYGGETAEFLMFAKGIRDACWAIDEMIDGYRRHELT
jgi:thermostable 8-oxoguanine DNA glycosylase